jgi:hypothetical protein
MNDISIMKILGDIDLEALDFTEEKECNESERVICKGTSTRRELKNIPNNTGYRRKEYWR